MKVAVISDTHNRHRDLNIHETDTIIHCGDFSHNEKSALDFLDWYASLSQRYKILVAGNHDFIVLEEGKENFKNRCKELGIIYLQDESITIEGLKFYGAPWSNIFGNWAFMEDDFELMDIWDKIESDTDILITHGPQYLVGDRVNQSLSNPHVGSKTLSIKLKELVGLKYHLVGHIHESYGIYDHHGLYGGSYITINASSWEYKKEGMKEPIIFEIEEKK